MGEVREIVRGASAARADATDKALFVRTSEMEIMGWSRQRIVDALVRETYLDADTAERVAEAVEGVIQRSKIEVLTAPGKDQILGATLVGAHAGERIAEFVLAMRHRLGLGKILATVHPYPTLTEGNKYVAGAWRRARQPGRLLALLARYHGWRRGA